MALSLPFCFSSTLHSLCRWLYSAAASYIRVSSRANWIAPRTWKKNNKKKSYRWEEMLANVLIRVRMWCVCVCANCETYPSDSPFRYICYYSIIIIYLKIDCRQQTINCRPEHWFLALLLLLSDCCCCSFRCKKKEKHCIGHTGRSTCV